MDDNELDKADAMPLINVFRHAKSVHCPSFSSVSCSISAFVSLQLGRSMSNMSVVLVYVEPPIRPMARSFSGSTTSTLDWEISVDSLT